MSAQGSTLLDGLKKKMRQTKEEMEKYKDECEEYQKRLQLESRRREEVRIRAVWKSGVGLIIVSVAVEPPVVGEYDGISGGQECDIMLPGTHANLYSRIEEWGKVSQPVG